MDEQQVLKKILEEVIKSEYLAEKVGMRLSLLAAGNNKVEKIPSIETAWKSMKHVTDIEDFENLAGLKEKYHGLPAMLEAANQIAERYRTKLSEASGKEAEEAKKAGEALLEEFKEEQKKGFPELGEFEFSKGEGDDVPPEGKRM